MSEMYYISASQAYGKLKERRELCQEVERFWEKQGIEFPVSLKPGGFAALGRHVPTFRFEDAVFIAMAEQASLSPTWLAYTEDKFVTQSNVKRSLLRPKLVWRRNKKGEFIPKTEKLVANPDWFHKHPLSAICTNNGQSLVEWHKQRLLAAYPQANVYDLSTICRQWGGCADEYYLAYLSLFLAHGVLFEDYHGGESGECLDNFTSGVFEPAVSSLERMFGEKPLVVSMPWWPDLGYYPDGEWLRDWRKHEVLQAIM